MTAWILILTLASGLSGPVEVHEEACKLTAAKVQAGEAVFVELLDGSIELVTSAECKGEIQS